MSHKSCCCMIIWVMFKGPVPISCEMSFRNSHISQDNSHNSQCENCLSNLSTCFSLSCADIDLWISIRVSSESKDRSPATSFAYLDPNWPSVLCAFRILICGAPYIHPARIYASALSVPRLFRSSCTRARKGIIPSTVWSFAHFGVLTK